MAMILGRDVFPGSGLTVSIDKAALLLGGKSIGKLPYWGGHARLAYQPMTGRRREQRRVRG